MDSGIVDCIPGLAPSRVADLPSIIRDQEMASAFLKVQLQESKAKYLIFTAIYHLESQAFDAFEQKVAFSIYNIGQATSFLQSKAMTTINTATDKSNANASYLKWLNPQSPDWVLYSSFGSFFPLSAAQMDEIVFLLVIQNETNRLQEICGDNGLFVEWCDQVSVLCHPRVGWFGSHRGWNSTKEAVLVAVLLLAFPIVTDQFLNANMIIEDWRIGWRVKREEFGDEHCLAKRDDIADLVWRFMDMESPERNKEEMPCVVPKINFFREVKREVQEIKPIGVAVGPMKESCGRLHLLPNMEDVE